MSLIIEQNLENWNDTELVKSYPYPLDTFQRHAVRAINNNKNVLCLAMTGSGKTLLADYCIASCLLNGKRVIFTSPIKALSNQKYKEFKDLYGETNVGIITGDNKFNPDAQILIMTAEILLNLLYKSKSYTKELGITSQLSLQDVGYVIMDEVHYINNKERGHVWEETLIMLPKEIRLVLLSATVDNPERLGNWLARVRETDLHMCSNTKRVVPLSYYLYKPTPYSDLATPKLRDGALIEIMDNTNLYKGSKVYTIWTKEYNRMIDYTLPEDSDEYKHQAEKTFSGRNRLNNLVEYLKYCGLCPAISFTFSRRNCELYSKAIQDSLITGKESAEIEHLFKFYTHHYYENLKSLPQYYLLLDVLKKGVAFHHSGLVPILKETVEIIFSKGYIKLLFATETFSVGLNMPTKTVIFLELNKPDPAQEGGNRPLLTDEFLQMAGRAGRRGKDTRGYVIYCPMRTPEREETFKSILTGKKSQLVSKMDFGFQFIMKSLNSSVYSWSEILLNSFWYVDQLNYKTTLIEKIENLEQKILNTTFSETETNALEQRYKLSLEIKSKNTQREIDQWNNTYIGNRWRDLYNKFVDIKKSEIELQDLKLELSEFGNLNLFMANYALYLEKIGYLKELPTDLTTLNKDNLTPLGIASTELNEGHNILGMELYNYINDHLENYTTIDILKLLSIFINDSHNSSQVSKNTTIQYIKSRAEYYSKLADDYGVILEHTYWDIDTLWYDILEDWISDLSVSEIMSKYDIMEGNFTRGILKLVNLIEEFRNISSFYNNVKMLELLKDSELLVVKKVVLQESIYIRL
jgi:superfamily II RNA helicase